MRNRDQLEPSEGVAPLIPALRRQFLTDLSWPLSSDALCRLLGLPPASEDVAEAEVDDSNRRMSRLADDDEAMGLLMGAANDAVALLELTEDPDERAAWLVTYILAGVNLLEELGRLEVLG